MKNLLKISMAIVALSATTIGLGDNNVGVMFEDASNNPIANGSTLSGSQDFYIKVYPIGASIMPGFDSSTPIDNSSQNLPSNFIFSSYTTLTPCTTREFFPGETYCEARVTFTSKGDNSLQTFHVGAVNTQSVPLAGYTSQTITFKNTPSA